MQLLRSIMYAAKKHVSLAMKTVGCMYEQYLIAAIFNIEAFHSELHAELKPELINKEAGRYKYH